MKPSLVDCTYPSTDRAGRKQDFSAICQAVARLSIYAVAAFSGIGFAGAASEPRTGLHTAFGRLFLTFARPWPPVSNLRAALAARL